MMKDLSKNTYWVNANLADDSFRHKVYYDLIELPGGTHLPVPLAFDLVGLEAVQQIPFSRKIRSDDFFYHFNDGYYPSSSFFQESRSPCDSCGGFPGSERFCESCQTYPAYRETLRISHAVKRLLFVRWMQAEDYSKLRYIRSDRCSNHDRRRYY